MEAMDSPRHMPLLPLPQFHQFIHATHTMHHHWLAKLFRHLQMQLKDRLLKREGGPT